MPKKHFYFIVFAVALLSISIAGIAFAQASGPPQKDTYVSALFPNNSYGGSSSLTAAASGYGYNKCDPVRRIYLEWDLSSITDPNRISSAVLTLTASSGGGALSKYNAALYESANAPDLNAITWNSQPTIGNQIDAKPAVWNGAIQFDSAALVSYLQGKAGGKATFMIQLDLKPGVTCTGRSGASMDTDSIESNGTPADLQITGPNAVTLATFSGNDGQTNWLLLVSLAGVLIVIAGGVFGLRRFTS